MHSAQARRMSGGCSNEAAAVTKEQKQTGMRRHNSQRLLASARVNRRGAA
jgi:hypothetical protein